MLRDVVHLHDRTRWANKPHVLQPGLLQHILEDGLGYVWLEIDTTVDIRGALGADRLPQRLVAARVIGAVIALEELIGQTTNHDGIAAVGPPPQTPSAAAAYATSRDGSTSVTLAPSLAAATAAMIAPGVDPYTNTSELDRAATESSGVRAMATIRAAASETIERH